MKNIKKITYIQIFLVFFLPIISLAHSGRTDSYGGHYDYSTGEYHYHHGYSAHQHINGLCPYETPLEDLLPKYCPNCKEIINPENGQYCFECGYNLISNFTTLSSVAGSSNKTRNEYNKEIQELKEKCEKLSTKNSDYIIEKNKAINEKNDTINKIKTEKRNTIIICFIVTIISSLISYNFGKNRE